MLLWNVLIWEISFQYFSINSCIHSSVFSKISIIRCLFYLHSTYPIFIEDETFSYHTFSHLQKNKFRKYVISFCYISDK